MSTEKKIQDIGELIRTQDNRATADPIFVVQEKKRLYGLDPNYTEDTVWVHDDGDCKEADSEETERLDRLEDQGNPDEDWTNTGYVDRWVFVTACFTEQGCQDFIDANRHNLTDPRIYVASAYRNEEFIAVRRYIKSLPGPKEN